MRLAIVLCAAALTGCVSQQQIEAQRAYEAQQHEAASRAYTENLRGQCRAIGYQDGTEGFRQCILQLHSQNQAQQTQMQGILLNNVLQQQMQQQQNALPYCSQLPPFVAGMRRAQGQCR